MMLSRADQWPIVYSEHYNIGFLYLERLHPFDSKKWGAIVQFLRGQFNLHEEIFSLDGSFVDLEGKLLNNDNFVRPGEATEADLLLVHTRRYLSTLNWSIQVARVLEVPSLGMLPNFLVQWRVLKPLRYQTAGTILVRLNEKKEKRVRKGESLSGWEVSVGTGMGDQYRWRISSLFFGSWRRILCLCRSDLVDQECLCSFL